MLRAKLAAASSSTFRSLHTRNFRLYFVGQLISQVGNWLTVIALTLLVYDRTESAVAIGLLTACQFGPTLLLGPWAGLLADRSDKRRLLITLQVIAMLQSVGLAVLAFLGAPSLPVLFTVVLIGGAANALDNPARRALAVEVVAPADVQNAVALNTTMMTSARIFGPAVAGALIVTVGYGWCFLLDALSYIAVVLTLRRMDVRLIRASLVVARGKGQVREGLRYVREVPVLWISLVLVAIIGTFTFNFPVVFPFFIQDTLGGDKSSFTLLYSITSIGSFVGALATAARKTLDLREVIAAAGLYALATAVMACAPNRTAAYLVGILLGFTSITFLSMATAIVQLRSDPVMRGRVLALQAMVLFGSAPIGGPILGLVCDSFGARAGLGLGAAAAAGAALFGAIVTRRVRPDRGVTAGAELTPMSFDQDIVA